MENDSGTKMLPSAQMVALTIRETLLKVCRHYQDPCLGAAYGTVAKYYEKQLKAMPLPSEQPQPDSAKLHS